MKTLSQALTEDREKLGQSQEQVAAAIGVTQQAYSEWEKGNTTPRGNRRMLLASHFGKDSETAHIIYAMTTQRGAARSPAFPEGWNTPGRKRLSYALMGEQSGPERTAPERTGPPIEDNPEPQANHAPASYIQSFESRRATDLSGGGDAREAIARAQNGVQLARQVLDDAATQLARALAQLPK